MTHFYRLSGAGNDFLALVDPEPIPDPETVRDWCRRGMSLGADGVFHLSRQADHLRLEHRNADGSEAELCVNGSRCAARLAFHLGWARSSVRLRTPAGEIEARDRGQEGIEVALAVPEPARELELELGREHWRGWWCRIGVPHLVVPWTGSLQDAPMSTAGPGLRHHPALAPEGANVDFVQFEPPDRLALRTFERGVEAETLACGSGVLASVSVGVTERGFTLPVRVTTQGGCTLTVLGESAEGRIRGWSLLGEARLLAEGEILPGARPPC